MPQSVDGDIRLSASFNLNTENVKQQAKQLKQSLDDILSSKDTRGNPKLEKLATQLQKSYFSVEKLQQKLQETENARVPTAEYRNLTNELDKTDKKIQDLISKQEKMEALGQDSGKGWQNLQYDLEVLSQKFHKLEQQKKELELSGKAFTVADPSQVSAITQQLSFAVQSGEQLRSKFNDVAAEEQNVNSEAARLATTTKTTGNNFAIFASIAKKAFTGLKTAARTVSSAIIKIASVTKSVFSKIITTTTGTFEKLKAAARDAFKSVSKDSKHGLKTLIKYGLGVRGLFALFRKLRGYASDAFKGIAQQSASFNKTMSNITNTFGQFKGSIGTMLQPLITIVEPVLIRIMNLFINAANAVGSFFATLTGQKYIYKAVKANNSYADSVSGTGKAAKEARKELAAYDKLVVISSQDANDASGGGSSGGGGFTEELIDPTNSVSKFAQDLKAAWESQDFKAIGEIVGAKINEVVQKIDDAIKWENVGPKIEEFTKNFGTAFNSLVDTVDWENIGKTVGDGLNTIIYSVNSFLDNFDIDKLGTALGEAFNGLLDTVDWNALGETAGKGLNELANTINNFQNTGEWEQAGKNLATAMNSLVETVDGDALGKALSAKINIGFGIASGFVTEFKWDEAGRKLSDVFEGWFNNIDWKSVVNTISGGLNGIATSVNEFANSTDWENIGYKLGAAFSSIVETLDAEEIGSALAAPFESINKSMNGLLKNFEQNGTWDKAGRKMGTTINSWFNTIDWKTVRENITLGIDGIIDAFGALFDETEWETIGQDISELINGFIDIDWNDVANTINKGIDGLLESLDSAEANINFAGIGEAIGKLLLGINWEDIFNKLRKTLSGANLVQKLIEVIAGTVEEANFSDLADSIAGFGAASLAAVNWTNWASSISKFVGGLIGNIISSLANAVIDIGLFPIRLIGSIVDWFKEKKSAWDEAGTSIWEGIFQGIANGVMGIFHWINENIFEPFIDGFKKAFKINSPSKIMEEMGGYLIDGLKNGLSNIWEAVKEKFGALLTGIKNWFADKKQDLINAWDAFKKGITEVTTTIKGKIDETFTKAKEAWNNLKDKVSTLTAEAKEKVQGALEKIKSGWDAITGKEPKMVTEAKEKTAGALASIQKGWDAINSKDPQLAAKAYEAAGSKISDLIIGWETIIDKNPKMSAEAKEAVAGQLQKIKDNWANVNSKDPVLKAQAQEAVKGSIAALSKDWNAIDTKKVTLGASLAAKTKETVQKWWSTIKSWFKSGEAYKADNGKLTVGAKQNTDKKTVGSWWDKIKSWWGSKQLGVEGKLKITAAEMGKGVVVKGNATVDLKSGGGGGHYTMATGGVVRRRLDNVTLGENGPEAVIPLKNNTQWLDIVSKYVVQHMNLGKIDIPHLAQGSVIPPNRQFLAMLGDQRHGTNVEAPLKTIEQALENVINRLGRSGGTAPIILQLDGKQIAKVVWSESDKRYKQTGKAFA